MSIVSELKKFSKMNNIAIEAIKEMDEEEKFKFKEKLQKLGQRILTGYNEDLQSCQEWLNDVKRVEELASLVSKKKNQPLPNSANIKYPLITKACYEFSSRTYPEILKDGKVVKARTIGMDTSGDKQSRCDRVTDYMNYQLLFENNNWELELDRLLNRLSLIGFVCKKTYYDPIRKLIKSEICETNDLIINSDVKSLEDARRISHVLHLRLNDLIEGKQAKLYCEEPVDKLIEEFCEDELDPQIDLIEQHCFADLDNDDYLEPYIITIVKSSGEILRIAPRFTADTIVGNVDQLNYIDPIQLFTDYHFLVSPKGKFQSVGFGILMLHLNEAINSILNMLVDAGQLANMQGGYKDSRLKNLKSGDSLHDPGEWKDLKAMAGVTLKDGILPINYKEPSNVLFQLLGLLLEAGKDLSSSSEVMTGSSSADNAKSGAVMALIQEGLKVFTSIQKRIYRSLTNEFRKIYIFDSIYLDPEKYYNVLDDKKQIKQADFDLKSIDIIPTADPNLSSELQRANRTQILFAAQSLPGTDKLKLTKLILQNSNLGVPVEDVMLPPGAAQQPPPEMLKLQAEIQDMADKNKLKGHELEIREQEVKTELYKAQCECLKLKADAILSLAKAESEKANVGFDEFRLQLETLSKQIDTMNKSAEFEKDSIKHQKEMELKHRELDQYQEEIDNAKQSETMVGTSSNTEAA